jgi:hypothetical protein
MSFDFANVFAEEFGEKLKIDKELSKNEAETTETTETIRPIKKSVTKSVKPLKKSKKSIEFKVSRDGVNVNFDHSMDAMIVSGVNKGRQVEVKYVLPANYEVEIGVNYDIDSSKRLEKGEIINHCVVLAEIGVNKYLTHCKKILFLQDRDIKHIKDGVVMIRRGDYKGVMGRIIKYNESKIGALLNFAPIIINRNELFFNDILLQNGKYFQVNRVELDDKGLYRMYGFEFGYPDEKMITSNDISEMSQGFKINSNQKEEVRDMKEETTFDFGGELSEEETEETGEYEETGEDEEMGEDEESEEMGEDETEEMRSAFKDRMRVYEEKSLTKKKAIYYDIVKKILEIKNIGIDDIGNIYNLVDEIENVLEKITNKLKIYNINFDMGTSLIDLRMIIACMVAYRIVVKGMNLGGFKMYISELYEDKFFVGNIMNSVLLNAPEVFNCSNLKKTRVELQKIEMLMICFDKEIQSLLNYQIRFDEIRPIDLSDLGDTGDLIALKRKPNVFSKRKFSTMEDIRKGEIPVGAKKMVWSGKQMMKIKRIKEKLKNKSGVDKYIYENIVNSPLLLKTARDDVVQYLFNKYKEDFMSNYDKCSEEKCQDRVIKQYLKEIKTKNEVKNEVITKYLKLLDVVFQIMNDSEITEDHIIKRFKTLGIDNSELINKK